jgi:hypothetical protein
MGAPSVEGVEGAGLERPHHASWTRIFQQPAEDGTLNESYKKVHRLNLGSTYFL